MKVDDEERKVVEERILMFHQMQNLLATASYDMYVQAWKGKKDELPVYSSQSDRYMEIFLPNEQMGISNVNEESMQLMRKPCQVCRQTGICRACNGTGQRVSPMSLTSLDKTIYEDCHVCRGSTRCTACGGDGWLDEGQDY